MANTRTNRFLNQAVLEDGVRSPHFFNGRLLSGEDLSLDQQSIRELRRRTGQALGEGVANGLEVYETTGVSTRQAPVVTVTAGLAVNRQGTTLYLGSDVDLQLAPPTAAQAAATAATSAAAFQPCQPGQVGTYIFSAGVYLLTIMPAQASEGRAPVSGLGNADAGACNARNDVEAVQFQLIALDPVLDIKMTPDEFADADHLRNRLAYRCFGFDANDALYSDPFGPPIVAHGLMDALRPNRLPVCNVPLALIYWSAAGGIEFIDVWSVRRGLVSPDPSRADSPTESQRWSLLLSDRRRKESEAMFLQFQNQVNDLRARVVNPQNILASQVFDILPPLGFLPVISSTSPGGFDLKTFFGGTLSWDIATIDANRLRGLTQEALAYDPIRLQSVEKIQIYIPYENLQAVNAGSSAQLAAVFASPALPYRGSARFDYARFDLGRFAAQPL